MYRPDALSALGTDEREPDLVSIFDQEAKKHGLAAPQQQPRRGRPKGSKTRNWIALLSLGKLKESQEQRSAQRRSQRRPLGVEDAETQRRSQLKLLYSRDLQRKC